MKEFNDKWWELRRDSLQRLTTLNAGVLALSVSLLTALTSGKGTSALYGRGQLVSSWIVLCVSIAFGLVALALEPGEVYRRSLLVELQKRHDNRKKYLQNQDWEQRSPSSEEVEADLEAERDVADLSPKIAGLTSKINKRQRMFEFLHKTSLLTAIGGYGCLIWFAIRNVYK